MPDKEELEERINDMIDADTENSNATISDRSKK